MMTRRAMVDLTHMFQKPIGIVIGDYVSVVGDPGKQAGKVVSIDPIIRKVWVSWTADETIVQHDIADVNKIVTHVAKEGRRLRGAKDWNPNPWAVCETSVGKKENPDKFERCVMDVKEKQASEEDIHGQLQAAGVELDGHASDLYAKKTPVSERIIKNYRFKNQVKTFRGTDGATWYDIPFANKKFWNKTSGEKIAVSEKDFWVGYFKDGKGKVSPQEYAKKVGYNGKLPDFLEESDSTVRPKIENYFKDVTRKYGIRVAFHDPDCKCEDCDCDKVAGFIPMKTESQKKQEEEKKKGLKFDVHKKEAGEADDRLKKLIKLGKQRLMDAAAEMDDESVFRGYSVRDLATYLVEANYDVDASGRIVDKNSVGRGNDWFDPSFLSRRFKASLDKVDELE